MVSERDTMILNYISRRLSISQRELARTTGLALGLINATIKRLIDTGYITTSHPNKRKLEYFLTTEGVLEALRGVYNKANKVLVSYHKIHANLSTVVEELKAKGYQYISVHGDGELKKLMENVLKETLLNGDVAYGEEHRNDPHSVILNLSLDQDHLSGNVINILERIEQ